MDRKPAPHHPGLTLDELVADEGQVTVPWRGRQITLTYRPSALNRDFYRRQRDLPEDARFNSEWALTWLLGGPHTNGHAPEPVLVGWDLLGKDGRPAPIDEATLGLLGTHLLLAFVAALTKDLLPNPSTSGTSADGQP